MRFLVFSRSGFFFFELSRNFSVGMMLMKLVVMGMYFMDVEILRSREFFEGLREI